MSNKSLQATRDGVSSSAIADYVIRPAYLRSGRWGMLAYGVLFIGFCFFAGSKVVERLECLSQQEVTAGFVAGFGLAIVCTTFGVLGGLCIGKFLVGFDGEFRTRELLVRYYDRLREVLGADFK